MTLPVKPYNDMPANFGYWTTPDLGRGPVIVRAACLRALVALVRDQSKTAPIERVDGLVKTIKILPNDWKRGFPQVAVTHDQIVQDALGALALDAEWREHMAAFIRRGRYGEALGREQVLDLKPILLPRHETPEERSERLQRITLAYKKRFPAQEAVVARIVDWATGSIRESPQARAHVSPDGSEWVLESGPFYESMERLDDLTVRLAYPQDGFPDRLVGEERLQFLHEMQGRSAEALERADGRNLCELAGNFWQNLVTGQEVYRPLLATIAPVVPAGHYFADLAYFGKPRQAMDKRIAFLRAMGDFRGEPLTEEEILAIQVAYFGHIPDLKTFNVDEGKFRSSVLNSLTLDAFFQRGWGAERDDSGEKTETGESVAKVARKLGIR